MDDLTYNIIKQYEAVRDGIKVEVIGHSNGKKEVLKIEIPTEKGRVQLMSEMEEVKWKSVQLPGSHLFLLLRTTIDGSKTIFLCKRGQKSKIVWDPKDLNVEQYWKLRRMAKELLGGSKQKKTNKTLKKVSTSMNTKLILSSIVPELPEEGYISEGGPNYE